MDTHLKDIIRELRPLLAVFAALLVITAVAYPLAVTGIGQLIFHRQANGSIVSVNDTEVGSSLLGQQFTSPAYFHPRPSAAGSGYDARSGSGSNLGPTSSRFIDDLSARAQAFRTENGLASDVELPADAVTASASGLDPHISPATARLQVERVAKARGADAERIRALVDDYTEGRVLGVFGEPRVNVLKVNMALIRLFPIGTGADQ